MAKKTPSKLSKFLKHMTDGSYAVEYQIEGTDETLSFHIRTNVPFAERFTMVRDIVDTLFETGTYYPASYRPIVWYFLLCVYTDLPVDDFVDKKHGGTLNNIFAFVNTTDIAAQFAAALGDDFGFLMQDIEASVKQELVDRDPLRVFMRGLTEGGKDDNGDPLPNVTEADLANMRGLLTKLQNLNGKDLVGAIVEEEKK